MCFFSVSGSFDGLCGGFYIIGTIYFSIRNRFVITIYQKCSCWHEDQVCKEICNCQEEHSSPSSLHCHICSGNRNGCISLAYLVWFCCNILSVLAHEIHQQVFLCHSVWFTSCPLIIFFVFCIIFLFLYFFVCCDWFWYFAVSTFLVKWLKGIVCDESPCLTFSGLTRSVVLRFQDWRQP